ncbi:MAG: PIN domain nuclease [Candidatus Thiodiazotropha sp. (ex Dulcina madagascariensis)]|nr:PIN domain nuclease [Candidatus Thiodiazotropha sp. (ex Dulcina madagascariensis)]MCU7928653.1 PIN domain nuclease [Candidatus Thiodiazotropha sp. (ex Dulcina madagascariensis)]
MTLVDSSVWIDYFNGRTTPETEHLDKLLGVEPVALGDLILTEVLQGFRLDKDYETAKQLLTSLSVFDLLGADMAIRCAENFRALRRKGVTIRKTIDVIIATYCIENSLPLLHCAKDFEPFHKHLLLRNALANR